MYLGQYYIFIACYATEIANRDKVLIDIVIFLKIILTSFDKIKCGVKSQLLAVELIGL